MHRFIFHTSPGFLVAKKMFFGAAISTVSVVTLLGGIHLVLAQQEVSSSDTGITNPPSAEQGGQMMPPPTDRPPYVPSDDPNQNQNRPPSDQQNNPQGFDVGGPNGRMRDGDSDQDGQGQAFSEEQQKKMEEQQQKQDAQRLKQMKQSLKQMPSLLKRVASRVASLKKSGINVSSDLQTSMDALSKDVSVIMGAQSINDQDVQDALSDLQDNGSALQNGMADLEQLSQAASMLKQANSQVKRLDASLARVQKIAKQGKIDISSQADAYAQAVSDIKAALQKAKDALAQGDGETAMQALQEDVFGKWSDAYQYETLVRALQNTKSNIARFDSFIAKMKKTIVKMEKAGKDTGDASSELDQMSENLDKLKQMITEKDVDPTDLSDLMNALIDSQDSVLESLGMPANNSVQMPQANQNEMKDFQSFQNFSFSFGGAPSSGGSGSGFGGQMNPPIPMMPTGQGSSGGAGGNP